MPRPRKFDEDAVVAASRTAFHEHGYAATSLDDLTLVTGLGRGSIYNTFGDKHAVFMRALEGYCGKIFNRINAELRSSDVRAVDRLSTHVLGFASELAVGQAGIGCFMAQSAAELSASDPEVAAQARALTEGWLSALIATVIEAQGDGEIRPDADPEALASMLLAVLRGIDALHVQGASADVITAAARQAMALLPFTVPGEKARGRQRKT